MVLAELDVFLLQMEKGIYEVLYLLICFHNLPLVAKL